MISKCYKFSGRFLQGCFGYLEIFLFGDDIALDIAGPSEAERLGWLEPHHFSQTEH